MVEIRLAHDLSRLEKLSSRALVYLEDHLGGGDGPTEAINDFNRLIPDYNGHVILQYCDHGEVAGRERILFLPLQAFYTTWALTRRFRSLPWCDKTAAFNFCVNKKRFNRLRLLELLDKHELKTDHYTVAWTHGKNHPAKFFMHENDVLHDWGALLKSRKNLDVYSEELKTNVFEPTVVSIITEPDWFHKAAFISEKTIYAFESGTVPLWAGGYQIPQWFKSRGFDIFEDLIDHDYQFQNDPVDRIDAAISLNREILSDQDRLVAYWKKNLGRFYYNRTLLRSNRWFYQLLEQEIARTNLPVESVNKLYSEIVLEHNYEMKIR